MKGGEREASLWAVQREDGDQIQTRRFPLLFSRHLAFAFLHEKAKAPRSFLFRSPHQQVGGTLLTALPPSTLPGKARAAGGTGCSYLLAPRVMPNHTFPQPGVGTLSEEISEHELETDFVTHGANLNIMVQFWQGPEQLWLGQGLRALGIWQNRALNANQLVKYKPSNFSSIKKKEEIWKGDRRPKFRAVSDSHNNNEAQLFPKHLHISLETGDRHLQG